MKLSEYGLFRGDDESVLALEDPEQGALGDARNGGELAGRGKEALLEDEREHGVEDGLAALLRGQRRGASAHALTLSE